ncbi:proline-rich protein 5-like [Watersipora subatra]|uniref:proline-rich protein 5-like n=1 Tax=Watersipora subatra TaxID=2589382 RepID=UPI00355B7965
MAERSSDEEEITLPFKLASPRGQIEDSLTGLKEPNANARYISKLPSLYTNEPLSKVQKGIIALFQKKPLDETLINLNVRVRALLKQDVGDFIVPYYEERILKKGMFILKEEIKHDEGENLLIELTEMWNYFYTELLPAVQVILYGVKPYRNLTIRERTLISFRDELLLKTEIRGSILLISRSKQQKANLQDDWIDSRVVAAIEQMFLVLLSVSTPAHKQYYELETLAAQVISPLMTARGVYYNGRVPKPISPASAREMKRAQSSGILKYLLLVDNKTLTLPRAIVPKHARQRSTPALLLKELFSTGNESTPILRSRTQSQSDIL